jgi:hypothetical protein
MTMATNDLDFTQGTAVELLLFVEGSKGGLPLDLYKIK